jgi:transposase
MDKAGYRDEHHLWSRRRVGMAGRQDRPGRGDGAVRQHRRGRRGVGRVPLWGKLDEDFRAIKGVADRTVARLMAELPEIGLLSAEAISKLVGLAPLAQDTRKRVGKRSIRGGRSTPSSSS